MCKEYSNKYGIAASFILYKELPGIVKLLALQANRFHKQNGKTENNLIKIIPQGMIDNNLSQDCSGPRALYPNPLITYTRHVLHFLSKELITQ